LYLQKTWVSVIIVLATALSLGSLAYSSAVITVVRTEPVITTEATPRVEMMSGTYFKTTNRIVVFSSTVYTQILICYYPCPEIIWWTSTTPFSTSTYTSTSQWVSVGEVTHTLYKTVPTSQTIRVSQTVPLYATFGLSDMQFAVILVAVILGLLQRMGWGMLKRHVGTRWFHKVN
jgi:hypothetical protein